jgi:hypothetical protein
VMGMGWCLTDPAGVECHLLVATTPDRECGLTDDHDISHRERPGVGRPVPIGVLPDHVVVWFRDLDGFEKRMTALAEATA